MPPELRLVPAYVGAVAAAASVLVQARSPEAAAAGLAEEELVYPKSPSGWIVIKRPDGSLWYIYVERDAQGFEVNGRSGSTPPAGIDPADIPVVEPPDGVPLLAGRLAEALRFVRFSRDGARSALLGRALIGVAAGDVPSEMRLAGLYRLERARDVAQAGHANEYVGSFLSALAGTSTSGPGPEPGAVRDLAAYFARDLAREREDLTIDARSAALVELFTATVAEADEIGVRILGGGLLMWLPMAKGDVATLVDHVMMLCRKWRPGWLETLAKRARDRAEAMKEAALEAADADGFARAMAGACHAAWLADAAFKHIEEHAAAVPGLRSDPLFAKLTNNAEELLVRTSRAALNWHWSFRKGAFCHHRLDVLRRMRAGGAQAGEDWAVELVENYFYYPRLLQGLLLAPDPGGALDTPDGDAPAIAVETHGAFLRALGLVAG